MILLDTHVYLWCRSAPKKLPRHLRAAIAEPGLVFVSYASAWEMAIKVGLGRLQVEESFEQGLALGGYRSLPISLQHIAKVAELPHHHRDPFDRMIVAQAIVEGLTIATVDPSLGAYGVSLVQNA